MSGILQLKRGSHFYLLLLLLSSKTVRLYELDYGKDISMFRNCLNVLGVDITHFASLDLRSVMHPLEWTDCDISRSSILRHRQSLFAYFDQMFLLFWPLTRPVYLAGDVPSLPAVAFAGSFDSRVSPHFRGVCSCQQFNYVVSVLVYVSTCSLYADIMLNGHCVFERIPPIPPKV